MSSRPELLILEAGCEDGSQTPEKMARRRRPARLPELHGVNL